MSNKKENDKREADVGERLASDSPPPPSPTAETITDEQILSIQEGPLQGFELFVKTWSAPVDADAKSNGGGTENTEQLSEEGESVAGASVKEEFEAGSKTRTDGSDASADTN